jgi:RNA polymerase sigma-70 factor (ECF subfamily)
MTLRERRRRPVVRDASIGELDLADDRAAAGMSERAEAVDAIRRALARLKPDERIVLALRYSEDRQVGDIAVLLGVPEGTVKWRLHEARRALERQLEVELR